MTNFPNTAKTYKHLALFLSGLLLMLTAPAAKAQCPGTAIGYTSATVSLNNAAGGTDAWQNTQNALTDDNSYVTMSNPALLIGGTVRSSNFLVLRNFGFDLPPNAHICGVQVEVRKFCTDNNGSNWTRDLDFRLLKNNQITGTNHANIGVNWPTTETVSTYGTNSDLWGTSLTGFDVSSNGFGVAVAVESRAAGLLLPTVISYIDQVRIRVYYYIPFVDVDGDGIADQADNDMDGDGLPDSRELITCNSPSTLPLTAQSDPTLYYPSVAGVNAVFFMRPTSGANVNGFNLSENYPAVTGLEVFASQDITAASDSSILTMKFDNPVHNLHFKLQDIDVAAGQFIDNITVNAYHCRKLYPITAANFVIGPGNFNTFIGNNTFQGLVAMDDTELNGTISVTIPDLVDSVQFIYKNADIANLGNQGFGFGEISFCNSYAALQDIDGDGKPGFRDADSDNDGIPDIREIQASVGFIAPVGLDTDANGLDNAFDPGNGGITLTATDTDNDGIPDYRDTDSDNDGISDQIEGNDADRNCSADLTPSGIDTDGDGLDNSYDSNNGGVPALMQDSDNNGIPDYRQNTTPAIAAAGPDQTGSNLTFTLNANTPANGQGYWSVLSGTGNFAQIHNPATTVTGLTLGSNVYVWKIYTDACHSSADAVSITQTTPLPVSLSALQVTRQDSKAVLNWSTFMEQNNRGFGIQRSPDGLTWTQLQFVSSHATVGNSSTPLDYVAYDLQPLAGVNYYRIFQQDNDGRKQYSEVRFLLFPKEDGLLIYPNPVTSQINLSNTQHIKMLKLVDATGKIVFHSTDKSRTSIDMNGRTPGLYLLRVVYENGTEKSCTVVKQ
jgi:hypothetical protein